MRPKFKNPPERIISTGCIKISNTRKENALIKFNTGKPWWTKKTVFILFPSSFLIWGVEYVGQTIPLHKYWVKWEKSGSFEPLINLTTYENWHHA